METPHPDGTMETDAAAIPIRYLRPGEAGAVLAGTAKAGVVQDVRTDILQGLSDLVRGVDVFFGRIALMFGMRPHEHDKGLPKDMQPHSSVIWKRFPTVRT